MAGRYDRVNGVFSKVNKRYDKVNGIWQPVKKRFVKAGGMWQPSFTSGIPVSFIAHEPYFVSGGNTSYTYSNNSNSDNFSLFASLTCNSPKTDGWLTVYADIYFDTPYANACTVGTNIIAINGTATKVTDGWKTPFVVDSDVNGRINSTTNASDCRDSFRLDESDFVGTTYPIINHVYALRSRGTATLSGFCLTISIYMYMPAVYGQQHKTTSFSIPWSAFTFCPTGEHLVYNP